MSLGQKKPCRRRTVCFGETLDDRTLMTLATLSLVVVLPPVAQIPPAASPFNPALVAQFEA
jgi:hypothetical protein